MLTIFNRKEVLITYDINRFIKAKEILSVHSIRSISQTLNLQNSSILGSSRARYGSFGLNPSFRYEYKLFVHKQDAQKALYLVSNGLD